LTIWQNKSDQNQIMCCVTLRVIRRFATWQRNLEVKLVSVPLDTALGGLKGSDSFFEIYTESYGRPIVIQGAGAGSAVTARGVFWDILRLSDKG
jgi:homoserine dehydrogenase